MNCFQDKPFNVKVDIRRFRVEDIRSGNNRFAEQKVKHDPVVKNYLKEMQAGMMTENTRSSIKEKAEKFIYRTCLYFISNEFQSGELKSESMRNYCCCNLGYCSTKLFKNERRLYQNRAITTGRKVELPIFQIFIILALSWLL